MSAPLAFGPQRERKRKRRLAVIDCETDPFQRGRVPVPFIWGFYDGELFHDFPTAARMLQWLRDKRYIIYAHNGGKFDFHFMFDHLDPWRDVLIINGRLARFKIADNEYRDSYCILPVALSQYAKETLDYRIMRRDVREKHMGRIRAYLKSDCVNLYTLVETFAEKYGTGKEGTTKTPAITLAGTAMKLWESISGREATRTDKTYYDRLRPYYSGGRVQCFRTGVVTARLHVFDINSAYPRAMMELHPFSADYSTVKGPQAGPVLGSSLYRIVAVSRGALPVRGDDGGLEFPDDDTAREYTVTGWEVAAGIDTGTLDVREWIERRDFAETINFSDYITHLYKLRMEAKARGDKAETLIYKLLMNSLYGKWCASPESYDNFAIVPTDVGDLAKLDGTTIGRHRGPWRWAGSLGPWALLSNRLKPPHIMVDETGTPHIVQRDARYNAADQASKVMSDYYNVATGASITGCVRAKLWRQICAVRAIGGTPLYCDTDAIACILPEAAQPGKPGCPFPLSSTLGDWTHEGEFDLAAIAGPKLYAFRGIDGAAHEAHARVTLACGNVPDGIDPAEWEKVEAKAAKAWKVASKGVRLAPETIVRIAEGGSATYIPHSPTFRTGGEPVFMHRTIYGGVGGKVKVRTGRKSVAQ